MRADEQMNKLKSRVGTTMSADEAKKIAAATRIQAHYRGHVVRKAMRLYRIGGTISEVLYSPAAYGVDLTSRNAPKPRARINANVCVVKNTMWLFGGIVEIGDREVSSASGSSPRPIDALQCLLLKQWSAKINADSGMHRPHLCMA